MDHSHAAHDSIEVPVGTHALTGTRTIDAPLQPGSLMNDRYRLASLLGRGGMSSVFQAQDEFRGVPVAVKVLRSDAPDSEGDAPQSSEVQILRALDHPHIVRAVDAGSCDSGGDRHSYVVLELVQGRTLAQMIAEGPLSPRQVAGIGSQIASALAHTHERNIVHRDIKPANILIVENADGVHATLTDFGVARVLDGTDRTPFGMTVGTSNYLSPEQALGQEVTARSDIYCLGLTLLEALTGSRAFPGHGVEAALSRLLRDPNIPARLGPGWSALLTAMTSRAPERRPSAAEVERFLSNAADDVLAERPIPAMEFAGETYGDETVDDEIFGPLACFRWQSEDDSEHRPLRSRLRLRNRPGRVGRRSRLQPAA